MLKKDKPKSPKESDEETSSSNEYIQSASPAWVEDEASDETPSIEKHGFMMYPRQENDGKGKRRSPLRCILPSMPVYACRCCGCIQKPCCPCYQPQWSPMQYSPMQCSPMQYSSMQWYPTQSPMFYGMEQIPPNLQERKRTKKSATQPKRKEKKIGDKLVSQSAMEDILENDGMKDMELASIFVNDARSVFRHAVSEEDPKTSAINQRKNDSIKSRGLETFHVNKAKENFDRIAKNEQCKNKPTDSTDGPKVNWEEGKSSKRKK